MENPLKQQEYLYKNLNIKIFESPICFDLTNKYKS